jgi:hypothetical protein
MQVNCLANCDIAWSNSYITALDMTGELGAPIGSCPYRVTILATRLISSSVKETGKPDDIFVNNDLTSVTRIEGKKSSKSSFRKNRP